MNTEYITLFLAKSLEPLTRNLSDENALPFLYSMGLPTPSTDLDGVIQSAGNVALRTEEMVTKLPDFIQAIEDKDKVEILEKTILVSTSIVEIISAIKDLSDEVDKLDVSGLSQEIQQDYKKFIDELPTKVINYLLVNHIKYYSPNGHNMAVLLGLVEEKLHRDVRGVIPEHTEFIIHWERVTGIVQDPYGVLSDVYKWGSDDFEWDLFLRNIFYLVLNSKFAFVQKDEEKDLRYLRMMLVDLYPSEDQPPGLIAKARSNLEEGATKTWNLSDNIELIASITGNLNAGAAIEIHPNGDFQIIPPEAEFSGAARLGIKYENAQGNKVIILGSASGLRIEAQSVSLMAGSDLSWQSTESKAKGELGINARIDKGSFVLDTDKKDGFLASILPEDGMSLDFDLGLGWTASGGLTFEGSGGLEAELPIHRSLGPVELLSIYLRFVASDDGIELDALGSASAKLGPINLTVNRVGATTLLTFPDDSGNLGPANLSVAFSPPDGVGLSIDTGAVVGGGYLFIDHERGEYAGALELTIAEFISAKAVGLITTRMPDGSSGFSMLIIVTAEFNPPFQLGFGFTLNGVGGLLGLNRTVLLDPLRDGVRTGAVNNIMFPDNVVENAPRIISDLKTIFPTYEDKFLIGPMGKMGWGNPTLITLSMGLVIEIPGNIAILGVMKVALPEERKPLVQIQVAFVGTLDFDKKKLTFDASLYESFILHMPLEGDMAVRLRWGDPPVFLLSVGGFHPSFEPPPVSLPTLRRLSISILNRSNAKIRIECYQAVTSNTVQFGAKAELYFDLSACSINGHIGFDALFQFSPFYFITELSSNFDLKALGRDVMSVKVKMSLEGTTPWNAQGTGSVSVLFFSITADFDRTWGDKKDTSLPDIEILPKLLEAFNDTAQWSADLAADNNLLVALRELDKSESSKLILHPSGSLQVQQKLMPLSVKIEKVGNKQTSDIKKVVVTGAYSKDAQGNEISLETSDAKDSFARAQYQELSEQEKLSKPSFEKMPAGVKISMGTGTINNGTMVRKKVAYQQTIVDKVPEKPLKFGQFYPEIEALFTTSLKGNSISKSKLSKKYEAQLQPFDDKLAIEDEGFAVAYQSDNKAFNGTATFSSQIMAETYMEEETSKNPALKKQLHIIPNYELQQ